MTSCISCHIIPIISLIVSSINYISYTYYIILHQLYDIYIVLLIMTHKCIIRVDMPCYQGECVCGGGRAGGGTLWLRAGRGRRTSAGPGVAGEGGSRPRGPSGRRPGPPSRARREPAAGRHSSRGPSEGADDKCANARILIRSFHAPQSFKIPPNWICIQNNNNNKNISNFTIICI